MLFAGGLVLVAGSFEMVNAALDGQLAERLRALRNEGKSIDEIRIVFTEMGFGISRETARNWLKRAGIPTHRVPAA